MIHQVRLINPNTSNKYFNSSSGGFGFERRRRKEVAPELLSSGALASGKTQIRGGWEVTD